jgi:hypothetical protein
MQELKLIVAGGRDFRNYVLLSCALNDMANGVYKDSAISIVSGMAKGADALAVHFAKQNNVTLYAKPADWNQYGKRAGFMRNTDMANFSDVLLAFWDGKSRGTEHMINTMKKLNKPVWVINY